MRRKLASYTKKLIKKGRLYIPRGDRSSGSKPYKHHQTFNNASAAKRAFKQLKKEKRRVLYSKAVRSGPFKRGPKLSWN
jgi:hypothetical protein